MSNTGKRRGRAEENKERILWGVSSVVAVVLATFLVVGSSRAAFSSTTENIDNTVTAGSVSLVDDDTGSAMFTASDVTPGDTLTKCIVVTYNGTSAVSSPVQLYRKGAFTGTGLEEYLDLTIETGTGGTYADCTGFTPTVGDPIYETALLSTFESTYLNYAAGLDTEWSPTGAAQSKTFRFTLELNDDDDAQGKSSTFGFTWEARS